VIQEEREGPSSEDGHVPRPTQDLLRSDFLNPSSPPSPPQKRKLHSPPPQPVKKARASSPASRPKPAKVEKIKAVKKEWNDSDEDAKFAAELDQALNSGGRRKTRGGGTATRAKPRAKRVKSGNDGTKKKRAPNPNSPFHRPMLLSPQLTNVILETELSRPVDLFGMANGVASCE
jgi:chromatin remodeling complex protein RSC6